MALEARPASPSIKPSASVALPLEVEARGIINLSGSNDDADGGSGPPPRPSWTARVDAFVEASCVGRYFKLKERQARCSVEVAGGVASFLTLSYISPVMASIVAETGATCDIAAPDDVYRLCQQQVRRELITSVGLASALSTLLMGLWANLPFLLAPGIGTGAYFAYSVVGIRGAGPVPYRTATTAVVIEGAVFLLLSVSRLRALAIQCLPESLKLAMSGGIGLFLAFIGLQGAEGLGMVTFSPGTLVTLGGCPPSHRRYLDGTNGSGGAYACEGGRMQSATTWLGLAALVLMAALLEKRVRSAVGLVILAVSLLAWFRDTPFTFFPRDGGVGQARYDFFRKVVSVEGMAHVAGQVEFRGLFADGHVWVALATILYTDVIDTTGCLYAMARQGGLVRADGSFEGERTAFCCDALGACIAGLLGLSPCVVFIESAVGIEIGARTGLAAVAGAACFLLSLVFNPILSSIPPYATGAALVLVGAIMMEHVAHVDWTDRRRALPAFMTVVLMPLTYSIAYGVLAGVVAALCMWLLFVVLDSVEQRRLVVSLPGRRRKGGAGEDGHADDVLRMAEVPPASVLEERVD